MFNKLKTTALVLTFATSLFGSGQAWALDQQPRPQAQEFFNYGGQLGDGSVARLPSVDGVDNCSIRISVLDFVGDTTSGTPRRAWDVALGQQQNGDAQKPNRLIFASPTTTSLEGVWIGSGGAPISLARVNSCLVARGLSGTASNLQQFSGPNFGTDIASVAFYGFSFDYDGQTYRYGWDGVTSSRPLNPLIALPDTDAPEVTLSSETTTLSNTDPFTVTATFSEDVTGFDPISEFDDLKVEGGNLTGFTAVSATVYTLIIAPNGNDDVTITVKDGAAQDGAGIDNTVGTFILRNTIVEDTQKLIAGFMLGRAGNLASNQPGLTRFMQGTGCGSFNANATAGSGSVDGCVSQGNVWADLNSSWSGDSSYTLGSFGAHGFVNPNLLIGGMLQLDYADDEANNISGTGWMVGPYFVAQVPDQPLFLEGRLLYGQTENDISPLGTYTDSFDTERMLAQLRATGEYQYQATTLMPLLDLTYTDDEAQTYTDSLGNVIPGQKVSIMQISAGMDFSTPIAVQSGALDLTGGLSAIHASTSGGNADFEGTRGRATLGLNYSTEFGGNISVGTFYDGIGSDYESRGANLSFDMKF